MASEIERFFACQILRHTVPHCRELFLLLKPQPAILPRRNLPPLRIHSSNGFDNCAHRTAQKLIILVPPIPYPQDAVHQMTLASPRAGVETLVPVDPGVLPIHYHEPDEIHLNSEGAAIFTAALATYLPRQVSHDIWFAKLEEFLPIDR